MRRYPCGTAPLMHVREQVVFGRAGRKILPARTKNHLRGIERIAYKPAILTVTITLNVICVTSRKLRIFPV